MKVVVVSKAFVRATYQRKLEEIASLGDVDLTLISPSSWREGPETIRLERRYTRGYHLLVTPIVFNGRFHVHFYPFLPFLLRRLRPDVVHVDEEPYNVSTWFALRAAQAYGARRLFFTWQDLYRQLPIPFSLIEADNYRMSNGAIAGVDDAAAVLRKKGYTAPIWVLPQFGTDPDVFAPGPGATDNVFTIGYVGRLVRPKGIDLLLRACTTLADPWRLVLVGDGDQRAVLARQAETLGIADRVEFRGPVASTTVPDILRELSVFVLPSRTTPSWREQFGRVVVEAMACAVPVIGSQSGQVPHVLGDAGLIFPENDWEALGSQLRALQQDVAARRYFGNRGRQRVLDHFTHRLIAEQTVSIYRALAHMSPQLS